MTEQPLFMNPDLPLTEPKLDPATITVGSEVIVVIPSHRRGVHDRQILTKVTKRGRVWITVETAELTARKDSWPLRLDTQHDGKDSNYRTYFYTFEQMAYRETLQAARQFLSSQGIQTDYSSPWRSRTIWQFEHPGKVQDGNIG
jgi:hypothetical protein